MSYPILIWGAGGHGKVVADLARICGHAIVGFIDRDKVRLSAIAGQGDTCLMVSEEQLENSLRNRAGLPGRARAIALGVGDNTNRMQCVNILNSTLLMEPLIHPLSSVSTSAVIELATVIFAGAVINAGAHLGRAVVVNSGAIVEHDCVLGDAVHVSPNATLAGAVIVEAGAWVGAGAVVLPRVRVGRAAIVGAGAVVIRDVPEGVTVVGNPAHPIVRPPKG